MLFQNNDNLVIVLYFFNRKKTAFEILKNFKNEKLKHGSFGEGTRKIPLKQSFNAYVSPHRNNSPVDFQPKMALPGDSLLKLVIYTPK